MKSVYLSVLIFAVISTVPQNTFSQCSNQINLQNPSFEGSEGNNTVPPSWSSCQGSNWSPSTQPGVNNPSSFTIQTGVPNAYNGNTYLGMGYNSTQGAQGVTQQLSSPMVAGTTYSTSVELAAPELGTIDINNYPKDYTQSCGGITIYGGMGPCDLEQALWQSPQISSTSWQNYPISFVPDSNWTYMTIVVYSCGATYVNANASAYIFMDTIAPLMTNFSITAAVERNNLCANDSTGEAVVHITSGPPATSYRWNSVPPQTDSVLANVPAGTYLVTVTSGNSCDTVSVTITAPSAVTASASAVPNTCFNTGNGSLEANASGGTPGYTYVWIENGDTILDPNHVHPGTYKVIVSDYHNCKATSTVTVDSTPSMNIAATIKPAPCPDYNNGNITAEPSGGNLPYKTYAWNTLPVQNSETAHGLTEGSYTVTVTDDQNCTASASFSVGETWPTDNLTVVAAKSCNGHVINGSISADASGGTPGYSYNWNPSGQTVADPVNLSPGKYYVTITDAAGCSVIDSATVILGSGINVNIITSSSSCGISSGFAVANASGGTSYTYHWNTGASTDTIKNIGAGLYKVTVTESGCSVTASANVQTTHSPDTAIINTSTITMCSGDSAYVCVTDTSEGFTGYNWSNGGTGACTYTQYAGDVYLTVTDVNGCTTESNHLSIIVFPNPPISISGIGGIAVGGQHDDTLSVYGVDSCQWFRNDSLIPGATNPIYIATIPGIYTVEITDTNSCHQTSIGYPFDISSGIQNLSENLWVKVYPNPSSSGIWQVEVGDDVLGGNMEIYDVSGRLVYQSEVRSLNTPLEMDVAKGLYLMQITTPYKTFNLKLTRL